MLINKNFIHIDFKSNNQDLSLRSATATDLENLRMWKNSQNEFFFHQKLISTVQQQQWFSQFAERPHDYMLIVYVDSKAIGCMGIRLLKSEWDIYNVILGDATYGRKGHMGHALSKMIDMILQQRDLPITLKVLKHNPAVGWYLKNGFVCLFEADDHYGLSYQATNTKDKLK
jgi:ribosomal protein S18 acetylase RimI-like enzyme